MGVVRGFASTTRHRTPAGERGKATPMAGTKRRHQDAFGARDVYGRATSGSFFPAEDDDRVNSPKNVMDTHTTPHNVFASPPVLHTRRRGSVSNPYCPPPRQARDEIEDDDAEKRVTIWNWREKRKLSGNSAPFKKNLQDYLRKHPDWEAYCGQDKDGSTGRKKPTPKKARRDLDDSDESPPSSPRPKASHKNLFHTASVPEVPEHQHFTRRASLAAAAARPPVPPPPPPPPLPLPETVEEEDEEDEEDDDYYYDGPGLPVGDATLPIIVMSTEQAARRRSLEMAARRWECEAGETARHKAEAEAAQKLAQAEAEAARKEEVARTAAWKAAQAVVAGLRAEKEAQRSREEAAAAQARRDTHEVIQQGVVSSATSRI